MSFYTHAYTVFVLFAQFLILGCHQILRRGTPISFFISPCRFPALQLDRRCGLYTLAALFLFQCKGNSPPGNALRLLLELIKGLGDGSYPLAIALIVCAAAGVFHLRKEKHFFELGALLIWAVIPFPWF